MNEGQIAGIACLRRLDLVEFSGQLLGGVVYLLHALLGGGEGVVHDSLKIRRRCRIRRRRVGEVGDKGECADNVLKSGLVGIDGIVDGLVVADLRRDIARCRQA